MAANECWVCGGWGYYVLGFERGDPRPDVRPCGACDATGLSDDQRPYPDEVVVGRARFERLLSCVESSIALEAVEPRSAVYHAAWYRWRDAFGSLQPGDRDPLS